MFSRKFWYWYWNFGKILSCICYQKFEISTKKTGQIYLFEWRHLTLELCAKNIKLCVLWLCTLFQSIYVELWSRIFKNKVMNCFYIYPRRDNKPPENNIRVWLTHALGRKEMDELERIHFKALRVVVRDYRQRMSRDLISRRTNRLPDTKTGAGLPVPRH